MRTCVGWILLMYTFASALFIDYSLPQSQSELLSTLHQAWTLGSEPCSPASVKSVSYPLDVLRTASSTSGYHSPLPFSPFSPVAPHPPSLHPLRSVVEGLLWTCFCQHWTVKLESMAVDWHAEYLSAIFQLPNSKPIVGFGSRSSRTARWALQRLNVFNQKPNLSRIFSVFLLVPTLIFPVIPAVTFSLHSHTLDTRELSGGLVCSWFGTGPEYCFVFCCCFFWRCTRR